MRPKERLHISDAKFSGVGSLSLSLTPCTCANVSFSRARSSTWAFLYDTGAFPPCPSCRSSNSRWGPCRQLPLHRPFWSFSLVPQRECNPELVLALSGALWRAEGAHHGLDRGWQQRPAVPDGERRKAGDAPADCHAQGERNQRGGGKANLTQTSSNTQALVKGPSWGACTYPECLLSEPRCKILIQLFGCKAEAILLSPTSEMGIHDRECNSWRITVPFDKALQSHPMHSPHQKKKKKNPVLNGWKCCISFCLNWWCSILECYIVIQYKIFLKISLEQKK